MPFIIWGSRGITSNMQQGDFYCPKCDQREEYTLKRVRPFFTLYFIPLFPVGSGDTYVECHGCKTTFKEEVLKFEPPSPEQQAIHRIYEEMMTGTSIGVLQRKLEAVGLSREEAGKVIDEMCEGDPRHCSCGESFHKKVRKCTNCGQDL